MDVALNTSVGVYERLKLPIRAGSGRFVDSNFSGSG